MFFSQAQAPRMFEGPVTPSPGLVTLLTRSPSSSTTPSSQELSCQVPKPTVDGGVMCPKLRPGTRYADGCAPGPEIQAHQGRRSSGQAGLPNSHPPLCTLLLRGVLAPRASSPFFFFWGGVLLEPWTHAKAV